MKSKKRNEINYMLLVMGIGITVFIAIPWILKIPNVRKIVVSWLSFTDNSEYKMLYIQLFGSVLGTVFSICGALWINKVQQNIESEKRQKECAKLIYTELNACFEELKTIFRDTKLRYKLQSIEADDIEKLCSVANGRVLHISDDWVGNLAQLNGVIRFDVEKMIQRYYSKLNVIKESFESKTVNQVIYISYICYFIANDGGGLHRDEEQYMERLEAVFK